MTSLPLAHRRKKPRRCRSVGKRGSLVWLTIVTSCCGKDPGDLPHLPHHPQRSRHGCSPQYSRTSSRGRMVDLRCPYYTVHVSRWRKPVRRDFFGSKVFSADFLVPKTEIRLSNAGGGLPNLTVDGVRGPCQICVLAQVQVQVQVTGTGTRAAGGARLRPTHQAPPSKPPNPRQETHLDVPQSTSRAA